MMFLEFLIQNHIIIYGRLSQVQTKVQTTVYEENPIRIGIQNYVSYQITYTI